MTNNENNSMCEIEHKIITRKVFTIQGSEEPIIQEIYLKTKQKTKEDCLDVADRFFGEQTKTTSKKSKKK